MTRLVKNWSYTASEPSALVRMARLKARLKGRALPPAYAILRPITGSDRWNALFLYLPNGELTASQRFSLERVSAMPGATVVVCAAPAVDAIPVSEFNMADALYWKALSGFDFSAYAILLMEVARHSSGADLYLQNDSVLGPFGDIEVLLARMPWRLGGFLASSAIENHLQSYALNFRQVDEALVTALRSVLSRDWAYDRWDQVVNLQETQLSRVAARTESVGALWYAPFASQSAPGLGSLISRKLGRQVDSRAISADPSLIAAPVLLEQGFPFLKRSLFARNAHYQAREQLDIFLAAQRHPKIAVQ